MATFHPDLRLARFLPRAPVGRRILPLVRMLTRLAPVDGDVEVAEVEPGVSVRVHRPPSGGRDPAPGVLYVHGGGYVIGNAAMGDDFCQRLAHHLDVVVAAVEYRLAPEHPYPVPLEDCHAGLRWLAGQPEVDEQRIALVGESAGAGLAAGLALRARERGQVTPVLQVLSYPMLDDRTTDGGVEPAAMRLWNESSNRFGWDAYLGDLRDGDVPGTAAPARAEDLAGLPRTWIGVGTNDLFHAEDVAWAQRLRDAGVEVDLHVVEGAYHGFDIAEPRTPVARDFLRERIRVLRDVLADPP